MSTYAVEYAPPSATAAADAAAPLATLDALAAAGVRYIRLQWVDLLNIVRFRVVPLAYFRKMLAAARPSVSVTKAALGLAFLTLAPGFSAVGEYAYVADLATLRPCAYAPHTACCMGFFEEKAPVPAPGGGMTLEVALCPRTTLRRVVEHAQRTAGVEFLVGFEVEFVLLKSTAPIVPASVHAWTTSAALPTGAVHTAVLEEIADALQADGIELQMYHAEAAPGQYEIVTGPLPPLQAADALVHTRETIANIAAKHGLRATHAPRVFPDSTGTALHTHISVHTPHTHTASADPTALRPAESSFLAALLAHLPALTALTLALPASYARVADGAWTGGTHVCWGTDNREAPLRLCHASAPRARNFELRTLDGTACPYVALAGVLGVGAAGVAAGAELRMRDCGAGAAAAMSEAERRARGITARVPGSWEDARAALEKDQVVCGVLGEAMVRGFLSANKTMAEALRAPETAEGAMTLLVENY